MYWERADMQPASLMFGSRSIEVIVVGRDLLEFPHILKFRY